MSAKDKGIYFALITSFVSGVSIFINSFAVKSVGSPLVFTATKNLGVGILVVLLLLLTNKLHKFKVLTTKEVLNLSLIAIIGGAIPFYLFFTGLSQIPAINGAIIHKTLVIWAAILAIPLLKERITRVQATAVFLLFAGNIFVGGFSGFNFSRGELYVLIATILWAVENVIAKKLLSKFDPDILTAARMFGGSLILVSIALLTSPNYFYDVIGFSPTQWGWMILTIISLLAYVTTWYRALKFAPVTLVASVLVSSTLVTNLLSAVFVTHKLTPMMIPQTALILFGVILTVTAYKRDTALTTLEVQ